MKFSIYVSTEFIEFSGKTKFESAASCVRDHDVATEPI